MLTDIIHDGNYSFLIKLRLQSLEKMKSYDHLYLNDFSCFEKSWREADHLLLFLKNFPLAAFDLFTLSLIFASLFVLISFTYTEPQTVTSRAAQPILSFRRSLSSFYFLSFSFLFPVLILFYLLYFLL